MASQIKLIQTIAGGTTRSQIVKVGLADSLNMYPETQHPTDHSTQLLVRSICGTKGFAGRLDGDCRGLYRVSRGLDGQPKLYGVFGNVLYLFMENGVAYEIQRIETATSECRFVETGGEGSVNPRLCLVDGVNLYTVDTTLSVPEQRHDCRTIELPTRINDDFTTIQPTHIAYLFGYLVINDKGTDAFYTSIQYPGETLDDNNQRDWDWFRLGKTNGKGFLTYSEWCTDNTTALISNGSRLYTFGPRSWQMFSFNNDKNLPFTSPDNAAGNIGIKAPNSLAMLGQTVLFLGASDVGENGIFMMSGDTVERVSSSDIEREFSLMTNTEQAYSSIWQEHRHTFYSITFEANKMTYVYDLGEKTWHRRASYDEKNNLTFWNYRHATFAYGKTMVSCGSDLCYMDENTFEEYNHRPILKLRRGGCVTSNGCPFYVDCIELVCNNGQHTLDLFNLMDGTPKKPNNGQEDINPRVAIRYSWDGAEFSDYEDVFLGKQGAYDWSTMLWHLGLGKYFTLEISTTERIPFCIENLKVEFSPTSNFI
jgi:hypothetical protein